MSDLSPLAPELLEKAKGDSYAAHKLLPDEKAPPWLGAFHAQQAVKKAIKSVLAKHNVDFPYTHQIVVLLDLLRAHGLTPPPHASQLDVLTPFGAPKRYEPITFADAESLDVELTLVWIDEVMTWCERSQ